MFEKKINNILFLTGKDGSRLVYKVLFTFYSEKLCKNYAVFYNEQCEDDLLGFSFDETNTLSNLQTPEEYEELNKALQLFDAQ